MTHIIDRRLEFCIGCEHSRMQTNNVAKFRLESELSFFGLGHQLVCFRLIKRSGIVVRILVPGIPFLD